jgi:hypothetical protein
MTVVAPACFAVREPLPGVETDAAQALHDALAAAGRQP